jgi:hypothetical protein
MPQMVQLGPLSLDRRQPYSPPRIKHQDKAAWIVGNKGFYDDKCHLWQPGEMLYYDGEPNADLYPLNKLAYDRKEEFLDKIDALAEKKAKKDGKAFVPAPRLQWREDGVMDEVPMPDSVMGARIEGQNEAIR